MNILTARALGTLPAELQSLCRGHRRDDFDEIVQAAAVSFFECPSLGLGKVFSRARSAVRRFTQDAAHHGRALNADLDAAEEAESGAFISHKQIRRQVEVELSINKRTAQRRLKRQLERIRQGGDLFVGEER